MSKQTHLSAREWEDMIKYYNEGMTLDLIAQATDRSIGTVYNWIRKWREMSVIIEAEKKSLFSRLFKR